MEVLERTTTSKGIKIQLEKWDSGYVIGAYPIARNSSKYNWIEGGRTFRLTIANNKYKNYTDNDVIEDFKALQLGLKNLEDLSDYFYNGNRDMYYLGMFKD